MFYRFIHQHIHYKFLLCQPSVDAVTICVMQHYKPTENLHITPKKAALLHDAVSFRILSTATG